MTFLYGLDSWKLRKRKYQYCNLCRMTSNIQRIVITQSDDPCGLVQAGLLLTFKLASIPKPLSIYENWSQLVVLRDPAYPFFMLCK